MIIITIIYGFRYNLDEGYIKTEIWSLYNIITNVVGRHCKLRACNKRFYNRKRPFGVHNGDGNEGYRKLHSTVCGNGLHTMYRKDAMSGMSILT